MAGNALALIHLRAGADRGVVGERRVAEFLVVPLEELLALCGRRPLRGVVAEPCRQLDIPPARLDAMDRDRPALGAGGSERAGRLESLTGGVERLDPTGQKVKTVPSAAVRF